MTQVRRQRPEAIGNRALFPTARIPGHARRRVRIPNEHQLVRARTTSADRFVLIGFLGWVGFMLVAWAFGLGGEEGIDWWLRLLALPFCVLVAAGVDWIVSRGEHGRARWLRWARARGLSPIPGRGLRRVPVPLLQDAVAVPVAFAGNVGGYRLAVGSACSLGGDGERKAHFRSFVYASLPNAASDVDPAADPAVQELLREQPNVQVERSGQHLVVSSPGAGSYGRLVRHQADPDLEPDHVDALCDVAVHVVRRCVSSAVG